WLFDLSTPLFLSRFRRPPSSTLFPYTTLFRSELGCSHHTVKHYVAAGGAVLFKAPQRPKLLDGQEDWLRERFLRHRGNADVVRQDRKSTRLNSSHVKISYAVFCLKKKKPKKRI